MDEHNDNNKKSDKPKKNRMTRRIVITLPSNYTKNRLLNDIIKLIINISLFIVIIEYTDIAASFSTYGIVIFAMWYSVFENLIHTLIVRNLPRAVLTTYGSNVNIIIFVLSFVQNVFAMVFSYFVASDLVIFKTTQVFFGFIVIFLTVRKIFTSLLLNYIQRKRFMKILREKGEIR